MSDPSDPTGDAAQSPQDATDAPPAAKAASDEAQASGAVIPDLAGKREDGRPLVDRRKKAVLGVPIEVVISVGKARPLLSELVGLRRDSVLTLDSKIEDPVEIMVGDRVIARGELQEMDQDTGRLCVRLTEVADLSQSL